MSRTLRLLLLGLLLSVLVTLGLNLLLRLLGADSPAGALGGGAFFLFLPLLFAGGGKRDSGGGGP